MIVTRKQQLARLQTLHRKQQRMLQEMSHANNVFVGQLSVIAQDGRDDRLSVVAHTQDVRDGLPSASGLSVRGSQTPIGGRVGGSEIGGGASRVSLSFDQNQVGTCYGASSNQNKFHGTSSSATTTVFCPESHLECDSDSDPTELYLSVQRKDWDGAARRAATHPHEAGTWVSRHEADGRLRWRLLPLHAAIIFRAPERIVSTLLLAFAQGAACQDDTGALPLHTAVVFHAPQTTLVTLLRAFAPGAACKNDVGALPLHLALRDGCNEGVLHLLLLAYPQGADVADRKGQTPLALARQSAHANREACVRALERGSVHYPSAATLPPFGHPSNLTHYQWSPPDPPSTATSVATKSTAFPHVPTLQSTTKPATPFTKQAPPSCTTPAFNDTERIAELEAVFAKTQETSQVLVEYVNSLEAQLVSRIDTERFLATKIANLDAQVKDSNSKLDAALRNLETKDTERARIIEAEVAALKTALADMKLAEFKSHRLANNEKSILEDQIASSEQEFAAAQANAAVLEAQLAQRVATEQSLTDQVSTLTSQLANSVASSSDAAGAVLDDEQWRPKGRVVGQRGKLGAPVTAVDAVAVKQARIMPVATLHCGMMASCAKPHEITVQDTTHQELLLEDAANDREMEDAEQLQAVQDQEVSIRRCEQERDNAVTSVNKQREDTDFMLNGEVRCLVRTASENEKELLHEGKEQTMSEGMRQRVVTPLSERAKSPVSAKADLGVAMVEAIGALEAPVAEENGVDQVTAMAVAFGTAEKPDVAAADNADTGVDKLRSVREGETVRTKGQEETEVANGSNEETDNTGVATVGGGEDKQDIDDRDTTIGMTASEIEDIALEEAVNAIKEALKEAGYVIERDDGGHDDDSSEDEENPLHEAASQNGDGVEQKEEEGIPEDKEDEHKHVGRECYGTRASREEGDEDTTTDAVTLATSSYDTANGDKSIESSKEKTRMTRTLMLTC